ncbi:TPA: YbbC/YhhH family protein [Escherichia coli]|uniref:protein YhhH n=1 Tax=Escherichia coli TaxID=562 RepID=UPI0006A23095|nr:protein YhhH [Escherichia coli]EER2757193.1 protein YhhH [Escherichia coli]EER8633288.1 protein YhhH [Escherichia coli]EEV8136220.1 protein YhhH [Escherichia coli]EEZ2618267.1 protein YhhH [Escherichia coli]EFA1168981.1 protein YhhH [Escherichia coli]
MSAEFMVICKKILFRNCVIVSLFVFTYNTWAQCNNNIKIMRKYESEGKYTVRNLVKNKAIALELAEIYVKNRYGQDAAEEEKPYEITELTTSWVVEGTIHSDQIADGVFIIEIGKNDGRILNFGHGK